MNDKKIRVNSDMLIGQPKKETYHIGRYSFATVQTPDTCFQILSAVEKNPQHPGKGQALVVGGKNPLTGQTSQIALVPCPGIEFHLLWMVCSEEFERQNQKLTKKIEALEDRLAALEASR